MLSEQLLKDDLLNLINYLFQNSLHDKSQQSFLSNLLNQLLMFISKLGDFAVIQTIYLTVYVNSKIVKIGTSLFFFPSIRKCVRYSYINIHLSRTFSVTPFSITNLFLFSIVS